MANVLHTIHPYRDLASGLWVFDDEAKQLDKEPFIPVTGLVIDALLAHLGYEADQFSLLFGAAPFPGAQIELRKRDGEAGALVTAGTWYDATIRGLPSELELWLCPALLAYFPEGAPERLYAQVVAPERWVYPETDEVLEAE